jgi:class II lanthipeptide synthase
VSPYRQQIVSVLRAVTIRGPTRYAWLGRSSRQLPAPQDAAIDQSAGHGYLVACLREELYYSFFCHGYPVPARWGEPQPPSADPWLGQALSQANTGHGTWDAGWTVERIDGEEALVSTGQLRARVPLVDCRASVSLGPGAVVSVRLPKELPERSPGFYTAVSDAPADLAAPEGIVRVYWNISGSGAARLVRTLTPRLNAQQVPFWLKVADHHIRLTRCDAAILYLPGDVFQGLAEMLRDVAATLGGHLMPQVPAFTLEFAPGVGLAEDVGAAESFGVRRCALLADGIVQAHLRGLTHITGRLAQVEARFAQDGVLMDTPYLEPSLAGRHVL